MATAILPALLARGAASLRPGLFGSIPSWLAGSTIGLSQPLDLSDAGQKTITTNVFAGLKTFANGGRATQVVVTKLPFTATANNAEYMLQSDLVSTGAGIIVKGSLVNWTVNLSGHTLTYGTATPNSGQLNCFGVGSLSADGYGISGGQIVNGTIAYGGGAGANAGWNYGEGYNPIMFHSSGVAYIGGLCLISSANSANLISGFWLYNCRIEYNTFDDRSATITQRQAPPCQVFCNGGCTIRWNRVLHARQFGFSVGSGCVVEFNEIYLDGLDTNSQCIGAYGANNNTVRCNNLYATGAMPTGLGLGGGAGASGWLVCSNWFEGLYTREALRTADGLDDYQNHAVGMSMRWGVHADNLIWNNTLIAYAQSQSVAGPHSPTGFWDAEGKSVFYDNSNATTNNVFSSNVFAAVSLDVARSRNDPYAIATNGSLSAIAVGVSGTTVGGVRFTGNRLISDICPLGLPDAYTAILATGSPPTARLLFDGNAIERLGANPGFALISYGGYDGRDCVVDFIGNAYSNVTEDTLWDIDSSNVSGTNICYRYGYWLTVVCASNSAPVTGVTVTVTDATGMLLDTQTSDANGVCVLRGMTRLHNAATDVMLTPLAIQARRAALSAALSASPLSATHYTLDVSGTETSNMAPPMVINQNVTNVTTTSADLLGALTSTGGAATAVSVYWGTQDPTNNWIGLYTFGYTNSGPLVATATGLVANTLYDYRFCATNAFGTVWASPVGQFTTLTLDAPPGFTNTTAITWTNTAATRSWGAAGTWDHTPAFDGTEDAICGTFSTVDITSSTLDTDRRVRSLTLGGTKRFVIDSGTPSTSKLIIVTGCLTETNHGNYTYINAPVQVDDGANANSNAVWVFGWSGGSANLFFARIIGLAGTTITWSNKTGTTSTPKIQSDNGATYLGNWRLNQGSLGFSANNALGAGNVDITNNVYLICSGSYVLSNNIRLAGSSTFCCSDSNALTLAGNLTGGTNAAIKVGSNGLRGMLKVAGTNNSAAGDVALINGNDTYPGSIDVVGTWTNAGNFDLSTTVADGSYGNSLQGCGWLGLAPNKKVYVKTVQSGHGTFIAPSNGTPLYQRTDGNILLLTNGTIGTLTIGTPGNNNAVEFPSNAWLVVNIDASTGSTLAVNGLLNLSFAGNSLAINGTLSRTRTYTLAHCTSRVGKFANVYWHASRIGNAETTGAINGTHKIVYSDTDILLVSPVNRCLALLVR